MSTITTKLDKAESHVDLFMGKLQEFPDIHSAGYIEYGRKLDGARETYNLLLRNAQSQGKYQIPIELFSNIIVIPDIYFIRVEFYFRLYFYFSNNMKRACFGLICSCWWNCSPFTTLPNF